MPAANTNELSIRFWPLAYLVQALIEGRRSEIKEAAGSAPLAYRLNQGRATETLRPSATNKARWFRARPLSSVSVYKILLLFLPKVLGISYDIAEAVRAVKRISRSQTFSQTRRGRIRRTEMPLVFKSGLVLENDGELVVLIPRSVRWVKSPLKTYEHTCVQLRGNTTREEFLSLYGLEGEAEQEKALMLKSLGITEEEMGTAMEKARSDGVDRQNLLKLVIACRKESAKQK